VLSLGYFLWLPAKEELITTSTYITIFVWTALSWLLLIIGPFFRHMKAENAYWRYLLTVVLWWILAGAFVLVIQLGILSIFRSASYLFNWTLPAHLIEDTLAINSGVILPWLFLARFPVNPEKEKEKDTVAGPGRTFLEYVCVPLLAAYTVLLYAYLLFILFTREWPLGGVSYMIIAYAVAGLVIFILAYPLWHENRSRIMKIGARWFFILLLPLIALLFYAIGVRLNAYGVTESRFYVLLFGIWLLVVTINFVRPWLNPITFIPVSLWVVLFLTSLGPLSASNFSLYSQQGRLSGLLKASPVLENGVFIKNGFGKITNNDTKRALHSMLQYLIETHGVDSIAEYLPETLITQTSKLHPYELSNAIISYIDSEDFYPDPNYHSIYADDISPANLSDSQWIFMNRNIVAGPPMRLAHKGVDYEFEWVGLTLNWKENGKFVFSLPVEQTLYDWTKKYPDEARQYSPSQNEFALNASEKGRTMKLFIHNFSLQIDEKNTPTNVDLRYSLMIEIK
jgi:hypothetical protein